VYLKISKYCSLPLPSQFFTHKNNPLICSRIRRNWKFAHHQKHKTEHTASGIVKPILQPAGIVDEMGLVLAMHEHMNVKYTTRRFSI
jgi:hypothetical protein